MSRIVGMMSGMPCDRNVDTAGAGAGNDQWNGERRVIGEQSVSESRHASPNDSP